MNEEERDRSSNCNRCLFILLLVFIFTSGDGSQEDSPQMFLKDQLQNPNNITLPSRDVLAVFTHHFEGLWHTSSNNSYISKTNGNFYLTFYQHDSNDFSMYLTIHNGQYIDDGTMEISIVNINATKWKTFKSNRSIAVESTQSIQVDYIQGKILQNVDEGKATIPHNNLTVRVSLNEEDELVRKLQINGIKGIEQVQLLIKDYHSSFYRNLVFSLLLFFISVVEVSALMKIFSQLMEGNYQFTHFSLITLLFTLMWDGLFCVIIINQIFLSDYFVPNIILFFVPGLFFGILFTNLDVRFIFEVFRNSYDFNLDFRTLLCSFYIIIYCIMLLISCIVYKLNLHPIIYILASMIYLPQIYTNALENHRPKIRFPYYSEYILVRLSFLFYLKCFPYNVYYLQPDYLLTFLCVLSVGAQFILLHVQNISGPKRVLPRFLLPPIYDYQCNISKIMDETVVNMECAICLGSLKDKAPEESSNVKAPCQIMKTPCDHHYHGSCLVSWMTVKMQCPQCRMKLPDYQ